MPTPPPVPPSPTIGTGYSYLTLTQALAQLALRLGDTSNVYWPQTELTSHLQTAMREWQSLTRYWRARFQFPLQQGQPRNTEWYDLTSQAGDTDHLLSFNVIDTSVVSEMLAMLLEPQLSGSPLAYVGTDMFSLDDLTQAIQRRRDQFLVDTGMILSLSVIPGIVPSVAGLEPLADSIIDVRRATWIDTSGVRSQLWKTDEWNSRAFFPDWETAPTDPPTGFSMSILGPLMFQFVPPPVNGGQLELLSVTTGATLNPPTGVLLGIPDNFVWVVMFGALADLLSIAGEAADPDRAAYCEQRYQEGIVAAKLYSSVLDGYINGSQVFVNSVFDLDAMMPGWQNQSSTPLHLGLAAYNMLAVAPIPDNNGPYSVMLDVAQNAPVPVVGADKLQLGREELDAVLGEAQHLAAFKQGGEEFKASFSLHQNFMRLALVRNQRLAAATPTKQPLYDRSAREEKQRTRMEPELPVGLSTDTTQ